MPIFSGLSNMNVQNKTMKIIKTALLSYGMSGKVFHAPFLNFHPGFELVGAWERSKKLITTDFPSVKSYSSLQELLEDDIDLVIVNTPVDTHFAYANESLLAGKHVLVEKAFTTTAQQAASLLQLADAKKLKLSVFQNRRWDSDFKTVQDLLNQNILGEIVDAEIHFDRFRPELSPKHHKETDNPGAGILIDLGSHIIDQALCLFGYPNSVFASIRITRDHSIVNDWFEITLFYDNLNVRLKASYLVREQLSAYIINGKKGSFVKNRADIQEDELKAGVNLANANWGKETEEQCGILNTKIDGKVIRKVVESLPGNYYDFFDQLYCSITTESALPVSASDGVNVMKIIDAALESNRLHKQIFL